MDAAYLHLIVTELHALLCGASLAHATAGDDHSILLDLRLGRMRQHLLVSANPSRPCLYLLSQPADKPAAIPTLKRRSGPSHPVSAHPFVQTVRRTLQGARLEAVDQPPWERLIRFRFQSAASGLALQALEFVAELTGRNSNLVLVEAQSGRILDCLRSVSHGQSRVRRLARGARYAPPPAYDRPTLGQLDAAVFSNAWHAGASIPPAQRLKTIIAGLSPAMQAEVLARAQACRDWSVDQASALWQSAAHVQEALDGPPAPRVYADAHGAVAALAPFPLCRPPAERVETFRSPSQAAERYYTSLADRHLQRNVKERLHATLRQRLRHEQRKLQHLQADLQRCRNAKGDGRFGDLLLAHLHIVPAGVATIELPDWQNPERSVSIALDPTQSAAQNAEQYYQRQRKARRALPILEQQQQAARHHLAKLEQAQERLQAATTLTEVQSWQQWAEAERLLFSAQGTPRAKKTRPQAKVGIRHYHTHDGWDLLVGAHSRGNDYLTTKVAREHDLWLHAYGFAGSHVVIRNPHKVATVPAPVVDQAARLAARFSKAQKNTRVDIIVTSRRYVKKRKGMPPGKVTVQKHDTITLNPWEPGSVPQPQFVAST